MSVADDVTTAVSDILKAAWSIRDGQVVPKTSDVVLKNGAVRLEATYVFADLADSSGAAQKLKKTVTAKIIRCYLSAASRILRDRGGAIRSFDGDRVMAIFVGTSKNTSAVRAALGISWALHEVIKPKLEQSWPTLPEFWKPKHGIGIATGKALIVRGGVRDNSDLVSIGDAPNVAAKLSELRGYRSIYITNAVYNNMHESVKTSEKGESMWTTANNQTIGGKVFGVKASSWQWKP